MVFHTLQESYRKSTRILWYSILYRKLTGNLQYFETLQDALRDEEMQLLVGKCCRNVFNISQTYELLKLCLRLGQLRVHVKNLKTFLPSARTNSGR